jgi:hypothetical protein
MGYYAIGIFSAIFLYEYQVEKKNVKMSWFMSKIERSRGL